MLGRMAGGVAEQIDASLDRGRHAGTTAVVPPSPFLSASPKLFLADDCGGVSGGPPVPPEAAVMSLNPTSTLQAAVGSPTTTGPAATAAPFYRHGASSSSGGDGRCKSSRTRGCRRPAWEAARHAGGLGLAGALNAGDDGVPHAATVLRGQSFRSPASLAADRSARTSSLMMMLPARREMVEASEDYTRVIARGGTPNPRTTHIFDGRVVVDDGCGVGAGGEDDDGESSFLKRCHGCSEELGQGKDIFMYRGEMAFCSHECRYREMLLLDEES